MAPPGLRSVCLLKDGAARFALGVPALDLGNTLPRFQLAQR